MASTSPQYGFGSGVMYGLRTDVANSTPVRFGVMQDVSIDFQAETKELYGQLQFPVDVARGKTKIMGKAKMAVLQASLYNNLFFGQTQSTGQTLYAYNEAATVPAASTYTVNAANAASFGSDLGVYYAQTGLPLVRVTTAPTMAGTYQVSNSGVYTFAALDASAQVLLNYGYGSATTGSTITGQNLFMGTTPTFQATFHSIYEGHTVGLTLFRCVSSKLTLPTKNDDYMIQELDFSAFAAPSGQVFQWSMDN